MKKFSERRLKENEVIFQQANRGVADFIMEGGGSEKTVIKFYCECSDINCRQRIPITAEEYGKLHETERYFIALKGHEIPAIENIVSEHGSFNVIKKIGEIPSVKDIGVVLPSVAADQTESG